MLEAIEEIELSKNIFTSDRLGSILVNVNILTTLTIIFVYLHVSGYYFGPFIIDNPLGESVRVLLLLPALIATPVVVIFNFYPRYVIRNLYKKCINKEAMNLLNRIKSKDLNEKERQAYMFDYINLQNEELKYRLRVSLSDLPFILTLMLMLMRFAVAKMG